VPFRFTDILRNLLFWRVIHEPKLSFIGTIDPYLSGFARNAKVKYCPDPCALPTLSSVEETRAAYGIRSESFVVLVYGVLDRRKCIGVLLEAAAYLCNELDLTVFLAGPQDSDDLATPLRSESAHKLRERNSLVEVNRYLVRGKDIEPYGAADVSWVFYAPNFMVMSSVLVSSGLARRPVIARRQGVIGRLVEEHNLGFAVTSEAPETVAWALKRLARDPALRREMGENGARVFAQNTPENFARPILEGIKAALGCADIGEKRIGNPE
jgi:glycosyltransferase involved in cell wall biosynthesis